MALTKEQQEVLNSPIDPSRVKARKGPRGMSLSYLEGYDMIDTANEIFGFDGWSLEIQNITQHVSGVTAVVRLRVGDAVREDVGWGDGDPELAHKEAVTDALKRVLRTFGAQFGNSLYDKERDRSEDGGGGSAGRAVVQSRAQAAPAGVQQQRPRPASGGGTQKPDVGAFMQQMMKAPYNLVPSRVLEILGVESPVQITDIDEAKARIEAELQSLPAEVAP